MPLHWKCFITVCRLYELQFMPSICSRCKRQICVAATGLSDSSTAADFHTNEPLHVHLALQVISSEAHAGGKGDASRAVCILGAEWAAALRPSAAGQSVACACEDEADPLVSWPCAAVQCGRPLHMDRMSQGFVWQGSCSCVTVYTTGGSWCCLSSLHYHLARHLRKAGR